MSIVEGLIVVGEGKRFVQMKPVCGACGEYGWLQVIAQLCA